MNWYDEQIKLRKKYDNEGFEDTFIEIAGAVMGKRLSDALNDKRQKTFDAIDDILRFYHVRSREVPAGITDINEILEYLMRPYGIMRRSVTLESGWTKDATGAMLGVLEEDGSVVAFLPGNVSGYTYFDTKSGKRKKIRKADEKLFEKEAMVFYKPFPMKSIGVGGLLSYIWENVSISDLIVFAIFTFIVTLVGMLMPKLNMLLFSDVMESGSTTALLAITVFMLCVTVSSTLLGTAKGIMMARVSEKLDVNVRTAAMMRVLSLPASFFKKYSTGELANRTKHIGALVEQMLEIGLSAGLTSLFSLIYILQIFEFAPTLVFPSIFFTLATIAVSVSTAFMQMNIMKRKMSIASKESGMSYAMIAGIQKIRLSGSEKRAFSRWGKLYAEEAKLMYNPPLLIKLNPVITTALSLTGTIVMYSVAVRSSVSVSEYFAFNAAYGMVSGAFMSLAGITLRIAQIRPILDMAKPILEAIPEVDEEKEVVERLMGSVEISNVSFRYDENMPMVLDNLSLKISPGQYVAIVGKTGCGKSTLIRILLGFEKAQKGAVYYDGKDLSRLDLKSVRRHIGTVMQDGKLFSGDIYSNIVISAPWLTVDDAWEAAEMAGMAEDIDRMPMGMHTIISEGQGGISGGQRQRLMIARAIAPKPRILIFDEATSALDNITQKKVSESLDSLKCTRIVIAHRLSTIKNCDRIIVLDKGHIIEDGTYNELMAKNGYFSELVERQKIDV